MQNMFECGYNSISRNTSRKMKIAVHEYKLQKCMCVYRERHPRVLLSTPLSSSQSSLTFLTSTFCIIPTTLSHQNQDASLVVFNCVIFYFSSRTRVSSCLQCNRTAKELKCFPAGNGMDTEREPPEPGPITRLYRLRRRQKRYGGHVVVEI